LTKNRRYREREEGKTPTSFPPILNIYHVNHSVEPVPVVSVPYPQAHTYRYTVGYVNTGACQLSSSTLLASFHRLELFDDTDKRTDYPGKGREWGLAQARPSYRGCRQAGRQAGRQPVCDNSSFIYRERREVTLCFPSRGLTDHAIIELRRGRRATILITCMIQV
jgi:hypothetical protein